MFETKMLDTKQIVENAFVQAVNCGNLAFANVVLEAACYRSYDSIKKLLENKHAMINAIRAMPSTKFESLLKVLKEAEGTYFPEDDDYGQEPDDSLEITDTSGAEEDDEEEEDEDEDEADKKLGKPQWDLSDEEIERRVAAMEDDPEHVTRFSPKADLKKKLERIPNISDFGEYEAWTVFQDVVSPLLRERGIEAGVIKAPRAMYHVVLEKEAEGKIGFAKVSQVDVRNLVPRSEREDLEVGEAEIDPLLVKTFIKDLLDRTEWKDSKHKRKK